MPTGKGIQMFSLRPVWSYYGVMTPSNGEHKFFVRTGEKKLKQGSSSQNYPASAIIGIKFMQKALLGLWVLLSCGSLTLIITPQYDDFFTRGLVPNKTYWPVARTELCRNIKNAVDWGSVHPVEAEAIGKAGQEFMETLSMERVYDYMYHLISEYAKLQDFRPVPASSSHEVCAESLLCFAEPSKRQFLEQSATVLAISPPCILPGADGRIH